MRFHSAGRNLWWDTDDECIARLISTSKKCGGYAEWRCVCVYVFVCVNVRETQEADGESECVCD